MGQEGASYTASIFVGPSGKRAAASPSLRDLEAGLSLPAPRIRLLIARLLTFVFCVRSFFPTLFKRAPPVQSPSSAVATTGCR